MKYKDENVRLVGILFARPEVDVTKEQILQHLNYFHVRSGTHIDFLCPGYFEDGPCHNFGPDARAVPSTMAPAWLFSDNVFNELRKAFEKDTTWHYSGSADLVIVNALRGGPTEYAKLDYSTAVTLNLARAVKDNAIYSVSELVESISRFCEDFKGDDPAWGFSDEMGKDMAKSALKELFISLLPKGVPAEARKAFHFIAKDIGK